MRKKFERSLRAFAKLALAHFSARVFSRGKFLVSEFADLSIKFFLTSIKVPNALGTRNFN